MVTEELRPEEPKHEPELELVPYRQENILNPEQQAAKNEILKDFPEAKSEFFYNWKEDGFKVNSNGEELGTHMYFGFEWVNALENINQRKALYGKTK